MKNTEDLRIFLLDAMKGVMDETVSPEKAKAVTSIAGQVYNTMNIELKTAKVRMELDGAEIQPVSFRD